MNCCPGQVYAEWNLLASTVFDDLSAHNAAFRGLC